MVQMSDTTTGGEPTITEWVITTQNSQQLAITDGTISICFIPNMAKNAHSNAKMICTAGNLSQKYGSLENIEARMIESEAKNLEPKDWEPKQNSKLFEHARNNIILERRVKELEDKAANLLEAINVRVPNISIDNPKDVSVYSAWHELNQLLTPKQ